MAEFFTTIMGHKFYEGDVPRVVRALEKIAAELERSNNIKEAHGRGKATAGVDTTEAEDVRNARSSTRVQNGQNGELEGVGAELRAEHTSQDDR